MVVTAPLEGLQAILSEQRCEDCGVIVLSKHGDHQLNLGAMNPSFPAVQELVQELNGIGIDTIELTAISAEEWEKWKNNANSELSDDPLIHVQDTLEPHDPPLPEPEPPANPIIVGFFMTFLQ